MRRTFVTISIFGWLMAGVYMLKDKFTHESKAGTPDTQLAHVSPPQQTLKLIKGDKHENRNQRRRPSKGKRSDDREGERTSGELDEIEGLTSIYQDQEAESAADRSAVTTAANEEELNSQADQHSSPISGVNVAAWVSSSKNAVPKDVPDPAVGRGMRYFLNCMELKKRGLTPIEAKDCDALIADRRHKN